MEFLILGAALLFFYFALQHFLTLCRTPDPTRTMILFIYTFLCGVFCFMRAGQRSTRAAVSSTRMRAF